MYLILTRDKHNHSTEIYKDIINNSNEGVIAFLNAMEEFVILIDPDSNKILFANTYAKKQILNLEDRCCWEALGYQEPCCHKNNCFYRKSLQVKKEEGMWKEHRITKINLSNKILIMESIIDIAPKKLKNSEKNIKNNLISMVSHELRTPLNIIVSTIQLLEKYNEAWNTPENLKHTKRIKKATIQINKLLRDILLVEKVEADRVGFNPQPIDVVRLTKSVVEGIVESISQSQNVLFLSRKESFVANVDEFLLTTILTNLLSNATKYSKDNEEVRLKLEFDNKNIVFKIIDKGIGIPEVEQKNLFKSFYRASNVGKVSGTGLGLAIVKDFIDIHKGSIDFISREDEGTTFTVIIPII